MGHSIPAACLKLVMILLMALPAHLILGCGPTYTVPPHYYACEYDYVIEQEGRMAERGGKDCALHNAQLGSAALAAGRADLAHGAFSRACKTMLSFEPDGEWKAIVVEERAKEWRGDPYEQLVAYLFLGLLDYLNGDLENAQASFQTALLADTGTSEERYRSDSTLGWFLLGKAWQRMGEREAAAEHFERAGHVPWLKWAVQLVCEAVGKGAKSQVIQRGVQPNEEQLQRELGMGVKLLLDAVSPVASDVKTPTDVLRVVRRTALDRLWAIAGSSKREIQEQLDGLPPVRIAAWIEAICETAFYDFVQIEDTLFERRQRADEEAFITRDAASRENNLTVVAYMGPGPTKFAQGKYNEILRYRRNPVPIEACRLRLLEGGRFARVLNCSRLEDVGFQAVTRGGREIDAILKKKAMFKDSVIAAGTVTLIAANAAMAAAALSATTVVTSTTYMVGTTTVTATSATVVVPPVFIVVALGMLVATGVSYLVAVATNPAADTRYWAAMPGAFYVASGKVAPGVYTLEVESEHPESYDYMLSPQVVWLKPPKGSDVSEYDYNRVRYGGIARDVEVRPGYETVVLLYAGPFFEQFGGESKPIVGHVPLSASGGEFAGLGRD